MVRKLFRTGNSLAVAVPGQAAAALGLREGDYVEIECDPDAGALVIWPRVRCQRLGLTPASVRLVGDLLRDYGEVLAALERP
jgi:antitoxin component of MazEF toxin-antitoxin module